MDKSRMRARGASGLICARVVMETHLGRPLTKDELVHHIDGKELLEEVLGGPIQ